MAEENNIRILSWPQEPAKVEHRVTAPISIGFEKTPAVVDMTMHVVAREVIPVCIKVCEPICAVSEYTIGIDIFDRPVAAISIKGQTRLFNCGDNIPAPR